MDGTLLEAWASLKSFRPKDEGKPPTGGEKNPSIDFHGQTRSNDTHQSTTDSESLLAKKGSGKEAKLCFAGHVLMENRNGLVVDAVLTQATGTAERDAALSMLANVPGQHRITLGADKNYDTANFVNSCRDRIVTPHVACRETTILDRRTTRHQCYQISQRIRKRVEEIFGWLKTVGGGRKLRYKGTDRNQFWMDLAVAAYDLVRIAKLALTETAG